MIAIASSVLSFLFVLFSGSGLIGQSVKIHEERK